MTLMTETVAPVACLSTAIQIGRDRQRVGTGAAPRCSRAYIGKLEAEGVIQRQGGGFPLDQSRLAYLRYLPAERRQSPRPGLTDTQPVANGRRSVREA
jgi:hypothetical protein